MPTYIKHILVICFFEGASVMGVELIGAKLIAPWFGTSLYVWTSVLGVSMLGLAAGYLIGGYWSHRYNNIGQLKLLLVLSGFFIAVMPLSANYIMTLTQMMDVRWGSMISSIAFILPPLLLMGMISPIAVRYCATNQTHTGQTAGWVFAASTVGGVLSVLLTGFYILPQIGLYDSSWIFSALMLSAIVITYRADYCKHAIETPSGYTASSE